jgi:hypothetical protein
MQAIESPKNAVTNPFPGLCLSGMDEALDRSDSVKLSIEITDPELAFVFHRHATYDGLTIEEFCKRTLLSVLENFESQFEPDIDPSTGLIAD